MMIQSLIDHAVLALSLGQNSRDVGEKGGVAIKLK